jgi:septum formation protein
MPLIENRIYLASRSPRRRELLKQIGVNFELLLLREDTRRMVDVDETPSPGELPRDYALRIAEAKAEAAVRQIAHRALRPRPVLAADTTVVLEDRIVGKPVDADHAEQILLALSGREHYVISAVALAYKEKLQSRISVSTVRFRKLTETEIRLYVAGGEPLGKAGAYAIQGRAAAFVVRIDGSYSGIMGLPLAETADLLQNAGIEIF